MEVDRKAWIMGSPVFSGLVFEGCLQSSLSNGHLMCISLLSPSQDGKARVLSEARVLIAKTVSRRHHSRAGPQPYGSAC